MGSVGPKDDHGWVKLPTEKQMVVEGEEEDEKMRRKMRMGPKGNVSKGEVFWQTMRG